MSARPLVLVPLLLAAFAVDAAAQSFSVKIDPLAAYLRVAASDQANDAVAIPLSALGVVPGESLHFGTSGDFDNGPAGDELDVLAGVFSGSATLLPKSELNRVADAIDAGKNLGTGLNIGGETTDIAEDFLISNVTAPHPSPGVVVLVPEGATHVFIAIPDPYVEDNSDPDADYFVHLTVVGTWTDVSAPLAGSAGEPDLAGTGLMLGGDPWTLALNDAHPNAPAWLILGFSELLVPFRGGVLAPSPDVALGPIPTGPAGSIVLTTTWPAGVPSGASVWAQYWIQDPSGPFGFASSQGVRATAP